MKPELNAKQELFVQEFLKDSNAKQAAIRAGYSPKTAEVQGSRLFRLAKVHDEIVKRQQKLAEKNGVTVERIIQEYAYLAFLDPIDFYGADGGLLEVWQMPERARRALAGMEFMEIFEGRGDEREHTGRLHKIKFTQKTQALSDLAKHLGMFLERVANADGSALTVKIVSYKDS